MAKRKSKKSSTKKTGRAECARNSMVRTAVEVVPGKLYARVSYCTTKRGTIVVKSKRLASTPGKTKGAPRRAVSSPRRSRGGWVASERSRRTPGQRYAYLERQALMAQQREPEPVYYPGVY